MSSINNKAETIGNVAFAIIGVWTLSVMVGTAVKLGKAQRKESKEVK